MRIYKLESFLHLTCARKDLENLKRFKKAASAIFAILKNPWLLNNVIADDIHWKEVLSRDHDIHSLPVVELIDLFPNFSETLETFAFLDGGSLPTDIGLLKALARRFKNGKYFEIGTWRGESVVNVSEVMSECYTLNLSREQMLGLGWDESYADLHGFFSKGKKNIKHLEGDSLRFDFGSIGKKFDLIFIDGNHHYDYIKNDSEKVFKHLLHEKSIVVWHDYAYTPEKLRPEVLAAILAGTPQVKWKNLYHVGNTMCAIYTPENLKTRPFKTPSKPCHKFKVSIQSIPFSE